MNIMKYVVPIIVGSTIGYFTNWLAIKMLFRPYEEKRIFGYRVPFTPGLIPKERYRVSKSVGVAVGEYLLTPDVILEVLEKNSKSDKLISWIEENLDNIISKDISIINIIENIELEKNINIINKLSNVVIENINKFILSDENQIYILNNIEVFYDDLSNLLLKEDRIESILKSFILSDELKKDVISYLSKNIDEIFTQKEHLKDIITPKIVLQIKRKVEEKDVEIHNAVKDYMKDDIIRFELYEIINRIVEENTSKLVKAFVSTKSISKKILETLYNYIWDEESKEIIIYLINKFIDRILYLEITDMKILKDKEEGLTKVYNYFISNINIIKISDYLNNKLLEKNKVLKKDIIYLVYKKMIDFIEVKEYRDNLSLLIEKELRNILNISIYDILINIDKNVFTSLINKAKKYLMNINPTVLEDLIKMIGISRIVENQINTFDVKFGEELILDIAGRELKAITNLGAVLGGIMGVIMPLLQRLY